MSVENKTQLERAQAKLHLLEQQAQKARVTAAAGSHSSEVALRSLTRLINQLKEEIARFETAGSAAQSR